MKRYFTYFLNFFYLFCPPSKEIFLNQISIKKQTSIIALLFLNTTILAHFNQTWMEMQRKYLDLCNILTTEKLIRSERIYCHPAWIEYKKNICQLILGNVNYNFLHHPDLIATMVRQNMGERQRYEIDFLTHKVSTATLGKIKLYKDTQFSNLPLQCKEFNCSVNTLGHLYYAANILEKLVNQNDPIITEFGSGYGNLARIFKNILPNSTIILIDLPELLALQYAFLSETLPSIEIILHTITPTTFKNGAIHLVPTYLVEDMQLKSDVFISTFALSETTKQCQELITGKYFFDASLCYIIGTLGEFNKTWVHHNTLHEAIHKQYPIIINNKFYINAESNKLYEIIASK